MKLKFLSLFFMVLIMALISSGCGGNDAYYDDGYYPEPVPEDKYVAYIGVLDWNNGGKLLLLDREKLEYSFERDVKTSPISLVYYRGNRYFYAGCDNYITSVYASRATKTINYYNVGTALLATDQYNVFALFPNGDLTYYFPDYDGLLVEKEYLQIRGGGSQIAADPGSYYVFASGTGTGYNSVSVADASGASYVGEVIGGGDAGIAVCRTGKVFAVNNAGKLLTMLMPSGITTGRSVDLAALGMQNPWGVACAGSKIYVTDSMPSGKVFVFDDNLNFIKIIPNVGNNPKYIAGDPENNYAYVSNQGDGYGNFASLAVIDPAGDYVLKTIGLDGHKPMEIAVMPWNR